ncbi:hypothetical protein [Micromonospora sp. NBC_00421]|uniref:hypothetical protein n=1 Tax=Micromonospora sp. NBC_00421 TaxID=2975976 RepID=UPI002E23C0E1
MTPRHLTALALAAVVLAGCGGDPEPAAAPTPSATSVAPTVDVTPEATPTEPAPAPLGATVATVAIDSAATMAVDVMWARCALRVPKVLDGADAKPAPGSRLCVVKLKVTNTGMEPGSYRANTARLITSAGEFASSGVARRALDGMTPVEGRDAYEGLNPRQVGYSFGAWEVPDDAEVQAVQLHDGQRVAVKATRPASL